MTKFKDGDIIKFDVREKKVGVEKVNIKAVPSESHVHINGIDTSEDNLKEFYKKMYEYAGGKGKKHRNGGTNPVPKNIDVYFIYNAAGVSEGRKGKSKIDPEDMVYMALSSRPAVTLWRLILGDKVKYVTAHSNGNVHALLAFRLALTPICGGTNKSDKLGKVIYHGLSMQTDKDLLTVSGLEGNLLYCSPENPSGYPNIIKFLHPKSTYYFNLGEESVLATEHQPGKLREAFKAKADEAKKNGDLTKEKEFLTEGFIKGDDRKWLESEASEKGESHGYALKAFLEADRKIYYINNFGIYSKKLLDRGTRLGKEGIFAEHRAELFCLRSWGEIYEGFKDSFKKHWKDVTKNSLGNTERLAADASIPNNKAINSNAALSSDKAINSDTALSSDKIINPDLGAGKGTDASNIA